MCLLSLVLLVAVTAVVTAVSGSVFLGLLAGWFAVLGAVLAILRLARVRHRHLMSAWAAARPLTDVTFKTPDAFVDPSEMPWWMDWAYYELQGTDERGNRLHFHVFITGAVGCLFRLRMNVTAS